MMRTVWLSALFLILATPAVANPPAAIPRSGSTLAESAFGEFARSWMAKVHGLEEEARRNPTAQAGSGNPLFSYRGYGDDYTVELRPTGHASAPYVGLLRYTEHVYSCTSASASTEGCSVVSSVPVTEIFRYQNGKWSY